MLVVQFTECPRVTCFAPFRISFLQLLRIVKRQTTKVRSPVHTFRFLVKPVPELVFLRHCAPDVFDVFFQHQIVIQKVFQVHYIKVLRLINDIEVKQSLYHEVRPYVFSTCGSGIWVQNTQLIAPVKLFNHVKHCKIYLSRIQKMAK